MEVHNCGDEVQRDPMNLIENQETPGNGIEPSIVKGKSSGKRLAFQILMKGRVIIPANDDHDDEGLPF